MADSLFQAERIIAGKAIPIGPAGDATQAEELLVRSVVSDAQAARPLANPDDFEKLDAAEDVMRARIKLAGYPTWGPWEFDFPPLTPTYRIIKIEPPSVAEPGHGTSDEGDIGALMELREAFDSALKTKPLRPPKLSSSDAPSFFRIRRSRSRDTRSFFRVARGSRFVVDVFSDEHPPPHFRVWKAGESANFEIATGERLPKQHGLESVQREVKRVWRERRCEIAQAWNERRPSNCEVGEFDIPKEWDC